MNAFLVHTHAQTTAITRLDHLAVLVSVGLNWILTNQHAKIKMNVRSTYMTANIPPSASTQWVTSNVIVQWDITMLLINVSTSTNACPIVMHV